MTLQHSDKLIIHHYSYIQQMFVLIEQLERNCTCIFIMLLHPCTGNIRFTSTTPSGRFRLKPYSSRVHAVGRALRLASSFSLLTRNKTAQKVRAWWRDTAKKVRNKNYCHCVLGASSTGVMARTAISRLCRGK